MYQPAHHREDRLDVQHTLIRAHPLATLITLGAQGLVANPVPFMLDAEVAPHGLLRAHIARANGQWQDYDASVDALVIFQGPQAYVTPSFYATKHETGEVVPTWNYVTVHAYGPMRVIDDKAWLAAQVQALTSHKESDRPLPWAVSDAPERYIDKMLAAIIGIEIPIRRIEGKWKISQNRVEADRAGVAAGLAQSAATEDQHMAALVAAFDPKSRS